MAKRAASKSAGKQLLDKVLDVAQSKSLTGKGADLLGPGKRAKPSNLMKQLERERQSGDGGLSGKLDEGATNADAGLFLNGMSTVESEPGVEIAGGLDDGQGNDNSNLGLDDLGPQAEPVIRQSRPQRHLDDEAVGETIQRESEVDEHEEVDETDPANWPDYLKREAIAHGLRPERFRTARDLGEATVEAAEARARYRDRQEVPANTDQSKPAAKGKFDPYGGKREEYGEETRAIIDAQTEHYAGIEERMERFEQVMLRQQEMESQRRAADVDKMFYSLNDQYDGAFGMLPINRVMSNSPEGVLRLKVIRMVRAMADDPDDFSQFTKENFETAAAVVMQKSGIAPANRNGAARRQVDPRLANRQGSMIAEPAGRRQVRRSAQVEGVEFTKKWLAGALSQS